jgi:hypothetical protein
MRANLEHARDSAKHIHKVLRFICGSHIKRHDQSVLSFHINLSVR